MDVDAPVVAPPVPDQIPVLYAGECASGDVLNEGRKLAGGRLINMVYLDCQPSLTTANMQKMVERAALYHLPDAQAKGCTASMTVITPPRKKRTVNGDTKPADVYWAITWTEPTVVNSRR